MNDFIVSYSGGMGSFCAAALIKERNPGATIRLVFCDTLIEDEDLYRFVDDGAKALDLELIKLADGRNPWQVFKDIKMQGNSRIAPCSRILKREVIDKWLAENYTKVDGKYPVTMVLGIGITEVERLERAQKNNTTVDVVAPMCDKPYVFPRDMDTMLETYGVKKPRLYKMGFPHNNCGGFCVRAGLGQFKILKEQFPDRFKWHKEQQKWLVEQVPNADKPFLRKVINGVQEYITLEQFENIEPDDADQYDLGGCACFVDDGDEG